MPKNCFNSSKVWKTKIGYVSPRYSGGVGEHVWHLTQRVARKHEVVLFANDLVNSAPTRSFDHVDEVRILPGVMKYFLPLSNFLRKNHIDLFFGMNCEEFKGFDIFHLHSLYPFSFQIYSMLRKLRIPYVVTLHWWPIDRVYQSAFKHIYNPLIIRPILKDAARIIVPLNPFVEQVLAFGIKFEQIEVIPSGFDPSEFTTTPEMVSLVKDKYRLKDNVLFVGRLARHKGVKYLCEAIPKVLEKIDCTFTFAGFDGDASLYVNNLLKRTPQVRKLGYISQSEKVALYHASKVFVLPSVTEAMGIVLLEAMACKLPIVVTDIPTFHAFLDGFATFVPPSNSEALADKITSILKGGKTPEIKNFPWDKYSWDSIANRVLALYYKIILRGKCW